MKRIAEIVQSDFPVGGYVGDLLRANPAAIDRGVARLQDVADMPVDSVTVDGEQGAEICRSVSQWGAIELSSRGELSDRRDVIWRGILLAYRVAGTAHPSYVATLRTTPGLVLPQSDDAVEAAYDNLIGESIEAGTNYPEFLKAADAGHDYVDPTGEHRILADLAPLLGFTMIYNHHAFIREWRAKADEAAKIAAFERQFAA